MKSALSLTLIMCLVASALPVAAPDAQEQTERAGPLARAITREVGRLTASNGESRYGDARLVTAEGRGRLNEVEGVLVSDPQARRVRFEVNDRAVFDVSYDQVTAMHYEESQYPKGFLNRSNGYLTVHYSDAAGQGKFETVRLSKRDVSSVLVALEADTSLQIDRSVSRRSFLGLPIYAAVGDTVYVTDQTGQRVKGTLTQLSSSSLRLDTSTNDRSAVPRDFDHVSIRKVELTNLRWRGGGLWNWGNNSTGTAIGVGGGVLLGALLALGSVLGGSGVGSNVALWGSATAAGGLLGYLVDRQRTRDVYRAP